MPLSLKPAKKHTHTPQPPGPLWRAVLLVVLLSVAVALIESYVYRRTVDEYVLRGRESLERVAAGRAEDCGLWVSYHAQDPLEISGQAGIAQQVDGLQTTADPMITEYLADRFDSIVSLRGYDSVALYARDGTLILASGPAPQELDLEVASRADAVGLYFFDEFDESTGRWYAQWVTPLSGDGMVDAPSLVAFRADMAGLSQAAAGEVSTSFEINQLAVVRPGLSKAGYSFLNGTDPGEPLDVDDPIVAGGLDADIDGSGTVALDLDDGSTVCLGIAEVPGTSWRVVVSAEQSAILAELGDVPRMLVSLTLLVSVVLTLVMALIRRNVAQRYREYQTLQELRYAVEAQDRFFANMSHELRTPLNSIMGFTNVLLSDMAGELNDEQRRQMGMIDQSSKRLLALVNDVLDLSKLKADADVVDISEFYALELGSTVCELMKPLSAGKSLECVLSVSDEDLLMSSDRTMIERILLNLLSNSIKFTQKGFVRLDVRSLGDEKVEFAVADSGCGIPADRLGEVMQEFRQIIEPQGGKPVGTGLGLAISKAMAESLGGELTVESTYGAGSTFRLIVPRAYTA